VEEKVWKLMGKERSIINERWNVDGKIDEVIVK
jgi:hypothetical protein